MAIKMQDVNDLSGKEVAKAGELTFKVKFPSKGKHGYPAEVVCRPLKVSDMKSLVVTEIDNEIEYLKRVVQVLNNTIVEPAGFNLEDVTHSDFVKVILSHRVNSLGAMYELVYSCPVCGKGGQVLKIDLTKLNENVLGDDYTSDPLKLETGLKFRYPRMSVFTKSDKISIDEITDFDLVEDCFRDTDIKIDDLAYAEYLNVVEEIKKWNYGIESSKKVKCSNCNEEVEVGIPFFLLLFGRRAL